MKVRTQIKDRNKYYDNLKYIFLKYLTYLELFKFFVCILGNGLNSLYMCNNFYSLYSIAIFVHV